MTVGVTTRLGDLTITRKSRCNRIDVLPVAGRWHTFFLCANCGRDLEVTTSATGYRHLPTWKALDMEAAK